MEDLKNNKKNRLEFKDLKDLVLLKINGKIFRRLINYSISSDTDTYIQEHSIIADFTLDVESVKDLRKEKGVLILDDTEIYDVIEFFVLEHSEFKMPKVTFKIKVDVDNIIIHFNRNKSGMFEEWRSEEELLEQNFRQLHGMLEKAYERNDIDRIERLLPTLLEIYDKLKIYNVLEN